MTDKIVYTTIWGAGVGNPRQYTKVGALPKGTRSAQIALISETGRRSVPLGIFPAKAAQKIVEDAYAAGQVRAMGYEIVPWINPHPMSEETKAKLRG